MTAYRVGAEPLRELGERCAWRHRLRWRAPNGRSAPGNATDPAVGTDLALLSNQRRSCQLLRPTPPACKGTVSVMSMSGWNVSAGLQGSPPSCRGRIGAWPAG